MWKPETNNNNYFLLVTPSPFPLLMLFFFHPQACRCGSLESADMLLGEGVHVDYQDEDLWTPLHMAAAGSHEKVVKLLIQVNGQFVY